MADTNTRTVFKTIDCDGVKVDLFVDSDDGRYSAQLDGMWVTLPSLALLEKKVRERIRDRHKIAIRASLVGQWDDSDKVEDIVITGRHAGNNNVLYHDDRPHSQTEQLRDIERIVRRMTPAEKRQLKALVKAKDRAETAISRFKQARRLKVDAVLEQARNETSAGQK